MQRLRNNIKPSERRAKSETSKDMTEKKNIMDSPGLREMPFNLPEGYFPEMERRLMSIPEKKVSYKKIPVWAASVAAAVAVTIWGLWSSPEPVTEIDFTYEDLLIFSNESIMEEEDYYAESLNDEDIIEYLLYSGINTEDYIE